MKIWSWFCLVLVCCIDLGHADNVTFKLNGLFSIQSKDGINYQSGVVMAEAMQFAIRRVNWAEKGRFLLGYRLQINNLWSDISQGFRDRLLATFVNDIPFLVGPPSSETSYVASILSGIFKQSVISYGASYSDFQEVGGAKNWMLRTVPSNKFRTHALRDLMAKFQWNYVNIITSYGFDGERDARYFIQELVSLKICLGNVYNLPRHPNKYHYNKALEKIAKDKRAKVLLLFTSIKDSKNILKTISTKQLQGRFQLFCVFGCTNYVEVVRGNEEAATGMLNLGLHNYRDENFEKYFLRQNPRNNKEPYFKKFWEDYFNCSTDNAASKSKPCTGTEVFSPDTEQHLYRNTPVHTVINAVYAIACAVREFIQQHCGWDNKDGSRTCFIVANDRSRYNEKVFSKLLNATFRDGTINLQRAFSHANYSGKQFGSGGFGSFQVRYNVHYFDKINGTFQNVYLGKWTIRRPDSSSNEPGKNINWKFSKMRFSSDTNDRILRKINGIHCSEKCRPGFYRIPDLNMAKSVCCWSCGRCPYLHVSVNKSCIKCAETEHVKDNTCKMLPQHYIGFKNNVPAIVFTFFSVVGFVSVVVVTSVFVRYNNHKVARASGRDLFYIMLLGIFLTFVCPFSILSKPTSLTCISRGILPGLAFLTCYAPLFLKTNRIYRIFLHGKKSASAPTLVSPQSQLLLLGAIIVIQILLSSVWYVSKSPEPELLVVPNRSHIIPTCKGSASPILMLLNLSMSVMFMVCCTVLAFKTRHFPKNFNEAKDIGVTLYVTCVVWAVLAAHKATRKILAEFQLISAYFGAKGYAAV